MGLILYGVYTLVGWCGGSILNYLGPKYTAYVRTHGSMPACLPASIKLLVRLILLPRAIGGVAYPFYVGSLWYYDRIGHEAFPLFAGALLGVGAALFWTTSGFIQFAYAEEKDKAKFITIQWVLSATGSTVGAIIAFCANYKSQEAIGVSSGVYIAFICLQCFAIGMALLLLISPRNVIRDDGRHIAIFKEPTLIEEVRGTLSVMTDPKIIILLPAMFVGEMCLALVSSINARYFNLRTRALSNLLFQVVMIPAPLALAWVMDNQRLSSRRTRGLIGVAIVGTITIGVTAGLLGWILRNGVERSGNGPAVDWADSRFAAAFILYLLFGVVYACFQITVQWTLASLTNEPSLCARYAGAFKGTVSLGMCVSFIVDSQGMSYRNQAIMQLVLYAFGISCLAYVIAVYVKETNYLDESLVVVPEAVERALKAKLEAEPGVETIEETFVQAGSK
ncbi:membrane transporter protein [Purpureocillium lavendulum]|uniref:Membrane transporter protein n=1 Tax=Purpureocillium lavendulum TaxID=1247861 RepID=A0AB34FYY0_9HYPO|nr:membrane transporter protein [Purpureocillium lavendulum]